MPTAAQAVAAVRSAIEAVAPVNPNTSAPLPFGWQGETALLLPNDPSPFVYTLFDAMPDGVIEIGGGRGANRHRQGLVAEILIFVPIGWGLSYGLNYAEAFAAAFRSFAVAGVICDRVTVHPGGPGSQLRVAGLSDEVANYFWSGCEAEFYFDQIG
jgi:hypothetical protein